METRTAVFPLSPLPSVAYFRAIALGYKLVFDGHEHYVKQTIRNRYHILGANGVLGLSIHVEGLAGRKIPTREMRIDKSKPWKRLHLRAIESAYRSSPFFDHYYPGIKNLILSDHRTIGDLFEVSFPYWLDLLKLNSDWTFSDGYVEGQAEIDLRSRIKQIGDFPTSLLTPPYLQVFADRFPFQPNLSVIDLLFNEGPAAAALLKG
jgi:hypothetical protein